MKVHFISKFRTYLKRSLAFFCLISGVVPWKTSHAHAVESCINLFNKNEKRTYERTSFRGFSEDIVASLASFGLSVKTISSITDIEIENSPNSPYLKSVKALFAKFKSRNLSGTDLLKALHSLRDLPTETILPLAKSYRNTSKKTLHEVLSQMSPEGSSTGIGFGSNQWLPGLLSVAEIDGVDSLSPVRIAVRQQKLSRGRITNTVLWTGSEASVENSVAHIDLKLPRLVVTKLDGLVKSVEALIFDQKAGPDGAWVPYLYEYFPEKGLIPVFETSDRLHSIRRCYVCHGRGQDFSPIVFKDRLNYNPAPGWFGLNDPSKELSNRLGLWTFLNGSYNRYNSIKKTRFDLSQGETKEAISEINRRLFRLEEVEIRQNLPVSNFLIWAGIKIRPFTFNKFILEKIETLRGSQERADKIDPIGFLIFRNIYNEWDFEPLIESATPESANDPNFEVRQNALKRMHSQSPDIYEVRLTPANLKPVSRLKKRFILDSSTMIQILNFHKQLPQNNSLKVLAIPRCANCTSIVTQVIIQK